MSQPKLTGEELGITVNSGVLRITADAGFTSDNGDGCPYRSVLVFEQGTNAVVYGRILPKTTAPDERWSGFFDTADQMLLIFALALYPQRFTVRVYGGSYFSPWVPGQPGPFIEWGYTDLGQNPSGVERKNEVNFEVPETQVPPPQPPSSSHTRKLMEDAARAWEEGDPSLSPTARITLARRIIDDANTDKIWKGKDGKLAVKLKDLLNEYGVPQ